MTTGSNRFEGSKNTSPGLPVVSDTVGKLFPVPSLEGNGFSEIPTALTSQIATVQDSVKRALGPPRLPIETVNRLLRNVESFEIPGAAEGESVVLSCNKDATHACDITMNFAGNTVPLKINVSHEGEFSSPTFNYLKSELEHILQFEFTDSLPEDGTTVLIAGLIQSSETLNQEVKDRALAILAELGIKTAEMVKGKYQISGTSDKFNGIYAMLDAKLESVEQGDLPPNPATNPSFN